MSNQLALMVFACVVGFFILDVTVFHLDAGTYVSRKLVELIHYLKVWR